VAWIIFSEFTCEEDLNCPEKMGTLLRDAGLKNSRDEEKWSQCMCSVR